MTRHLHFSTYKKRRLDSGSSEYTLDSCQPIILLLKNPNPISKLTNWAIHPHQLVIFLITTYDFFFYRLALKISLLCLLIKSFFVQLMDKPSNFVGGGGSSCY